MMHTQWRDDFTTVVPNRATAYDGTAQTGFHTDMPFTNMIGNGGLLSTMSDSDALEREPRSSNGRRARRSSTRCRRACGSRAAARSPTRWASASTTIKASREISHDGSTAGYRTFLARYPDQHVSVAVWCNYAGAGPAVLGRQVADLVLTKPSVVAQAKPTPVVLSASELTRWAGLYRDPHTDQVIALAASEGGLSAGGGRGVSAWTPIAPDRFASPQGEARFEGATGRRRIALVREAGDTVRFEEVQPLRPRFRTPTTSGRTSATN